MTVIHRAGIRWREDVGWELRCDDCAGRAGTASYWPLTHDFWDPRAMQRCRACTNSRRNQRERERYASDPAYRAAMLAKVRAQRAQTPAVKRRIYYLENIERERRKARERYWRDVEKTRARRREMRQRNAA